MKTVVKDRIEELRSQMQKIASDKALTDPSVVMASEKLDVVINQFYLGRIRGKGHSRDKYYQTL